MMYLEKKLLSVAIASASSPLPNISVSTNLSTIRDTWNNTCIVYTQKVMCTLELQTRIATHLCTINKEAVQDVDCHLTIHHSQEDGEKPTQ